MISPNRFNGLESGSDDALRKPLKWFQDIELRFDTGVKPPRE